MLKLWLSSLILSFTVLMPVSHAQDGVRNGGDSNEIEFLLIAKKINQWFQIEKNSVRYGNELATSAEAPSVIGTVVVKAALHDIVPLLTVSFTDEEVRMPINRANPAAVPEYLSRVCVNFSNARGMVCNRKAWLNADENLKYLLVYHEILGAFGPEKNMADFSAYQLTLELSSFVNEIKAETVLTESTLLKCGDSDYRILLDTLPSGKILLSLYLRYDEISKRELNLDAAGATDQVLSSKRTVVTLLNLTNQNSKIRAYIQVEHKGLFLSKDILQCNSHH